MMKHWKSSKQCKDDEFYDFLMTNEKDTESTNFNSFIGKLEKSTKRAGLKWTKKRENAIRKYFTTTDENANVVLDKKEIQSRIAI